MHPIAFSIFGHEIHYYGVCIALGFLAATGSLQWKRKRAGMTADQIFDMAMLALFSGIVGARLLFVIQEWDLHNGIAWIIRIDQGGLVFYGGFILAVIFVCLYAKRKHISIPALLDIAAPAIAVAHAFGRLGCFMQGCCFGKPVEPGYANGVRFPLDPAPGRFPQALHGLDGFTCALYPTQLWESAANLLLCILLLGLFRYLKKPGQIAGSYLIMYAVIRFMIEFYRGDNPEFLLGLTTSQSIALFLMIPVGAILLMAAKNKPELENYAG